MGDVVGGVVGEVVREAVGDVVGDKVGDEVALSRECKYRKQGDNYLLLSCRRYPFSCSV